MPVPPDPRPQRPGLTQLGEGVAGNFVRFNTGNGEVQGRVEDAGVSVADLAPASAAISGLTEDVVPKSNAAGDNLVDSAIVDDGVTVTLSEPLVIPSAAPAAADSDGKTGTVTWDADFIYVCVDTDTWVRAAIATWP